MLRKINEICCSEQRSPASIACSIVDAQHVESRGFRTMSGTVATGAFARLHACWRCKGDDARQGFEEPGVKLISEAFWNCIMMNHFDKFWLLHIFCRIEQADGGIQTWAPGHKDQQRHSDLAFCIGRARLTVASWHGFFRRLPQLILNMGWDHQPVEVSYLRPFPFWSGFWSSMALRKCQQYPNGLVFYQGRLLVAHYFGELQADGLTVAYWIIWYDNDMGFDMSQNIPPYITNEKHILYLIIILFHEFVW